MGRYRRPYLPGCVFHLTARTVRRVHWFTPRLRSAILATLVDVVGPSRMRLLAVAVMSNHLHIVAQQGDRPLSALMQPLLRRIALQVHDAHGIEGPVFWRHYASRACLDPTYARNAVVYVHLNPVRAGLCDEPGQYAWTSHALYVADPGNDLPPHLRRLATVLDPVLALPLFAAGAERTVAQMRTDYREFLTRRRLADDLETDAVVSPIPPPSPNPPPLPGAQWGSALSPLFHPPARMPSNGHDDELHPVAPDLSTIARRVLAAEAPSMSIATLRKSKGGRARVRARHAVIRRLSAAGFRNVQIARFLRLSDSAVSYVLRQSG